MQVGMTFFSVIMVLLSGLSVAQAVNMERSVEVTTKEKNPAVARRLLVDQAQTLAIEDLVRETMGPERFQKNRAAIQSKVLKMSSRLIPFSKAGELEALPNEEGFKMTVLVRINVDDLDQLLISQGLYFENDVPPLILPLVLWQDRLNSDRYAWWMMSADQAPALSAWNAEFEKILRQEFLKEAFYVLRPQAFRFQDTLGGTPPMVLTPQDVQNLSQGRGSQVALVGDIQLEKGANGPELNIKLQVLHVPRNRVLAQAGRKLSLEKASRAGSLSPRIRDAFEAVAKDLANQSLESWQRGAIQSNPYRITVIGGMSPQAIEVFREAFRSKVREVKNLRERIVTAQSVVFEMDSPVAPKEMAQRVSEIEAKDAKIQLKEVLPTELRFQVLAK